MRMDQGLYLRVYQDTRLTGGEPPGTALEAVLIPIRDTVYQILCTEHRCAVDVAVLRFILSAFGHTNENFA